MQKCCAVFVDDEPAVLDGLRRMLRRQRKSWNLHFMLGADAALDLLNSQTADIVISDYRMPGMCGIDLLEKIRVQHPGCVRVLLTGEVQRDVLRMALRTAHQFIAKPCQSERIIRLLSSIEESFAIISDNRHRQELLQVRHPAFTTIGNEALKNSALKCQIIKEDSSLACLALRVMNSTITFDEECILDLEKICEQVDEHALYDFYNAEDEGDYKVLTQIEQIFYYSIWGFFRERSIMESQLKRVNQSFSQDLGQEGHHG